MSLVQTLQELTMQTVEADKPADIVMGEVLSVYSDRSKRYFTCKFFSFDTCCERLLCRY